MAFTEVGLINYKCGPEMYGSLVNEKSLLKSQLWYFCRSLQVIMARGTNLLVVEVKSAKMPIRVKKSVQQGGGKDAERMKKGCRQALFGCWPQQMPAI